MPGLTPVKAMQNAVSVYALGLLPVAFSLNAASSPTRARCRVVSKIFDAASAAAGNNSEFLDDLVGGSGIWHRHLSYAFDDAAEFFRVLERHVVESQDYWTEQITQVAGLRPSVGNEASKSQRKTSTYPTEVYLL